MQDILICAAWLIKSIVDTERESGSSDTFSQSTDAQLCQMRSCESSDYLLYF